MPIRFLPLVTDEIYHVLNRGTGAIPIFRRYRDYTKFKEAMFYYQNTDPPFRFSKFLKLAFKERLVLKEKMKRRKNFWVEIIAYCLMPNHFHLLLKQVKDQGIFHFMRLLQSSYSHYFNLKYKRKGGLFEDRFKAIRVETDSQLLHLSRYIHLNPYSSYLVKDLSALLKYPHSSLPEYLDHKKPQLCQKEIVLDQFPNRSAYKEFLLDRADYQRSLEEIKHHSLED